MKMTPIIDTVTESVPKWVHWLNPAAGLLVLSRDSLIQNSLPFAGMATVYAVIAIPLLLMGLLVYRVSLPILIERMPN
jgi:lipopolysaccharide transport system permease protein